MNGLKPVAPYREVMIKGRIYKRTGISPAREALSRKRTALAPGEPGTDENPIMKDGIPYVYSSTGKLVQLLEFDPETMETFVLTPDCVLTDEQIQMIKKAEEMPVIYDSDCPKSTPERLDKFRQYGIARNNRRRAKLAAQ